MNRPKDVQDRLALDMAESLALQADRVARDGESDPGEARRLLRLLAGATRDALDIARVRGTKLEEAALEHPSDEEEGRSDGTSGKAGRVPAQGFRRPAEPNVKDPAGE